MEVILWQLWIKIAAIQFESSIIQEVTPHQAFWHQDWKKRLRNNQDMLENVYFWR